MTTPIINFSGIASGIDSASLIKALLDRERQSREAPLQNRISQLTDTNSSLSELKSLAGALSSAAAKFRLVNGTALSKFSSSSDETAVTAQASNSATNAAYTISVSQIAKNATLSFASTAGVYHSGSDKISEGAAFSDTVAVKVGDPGSPVETVNIDVDQNTTLDQFASKFNNTATHAIASIVNVGTSASPDYKLLITSDKTGQAEGALSVTVGATLSGRGAFDSNAKDDAKDAVFTLSGVSGAIQRASNTVSDLIPGLTLNLKGAGAATISIGDDPQTTRQTVQDFVDAYNKIADYLDQKNVVQKESDKVDALNVFGPLANTSLDENFLSALRSAFISSSISGGAINTLADLGITTQRDGKLAFDGAVFEKAVGSDPESVRDITSKLGETLSAVGGTIAQFTQFNGLFDQVINENTTSIGDNQKRIAEVEKGLAQEEETLNQRFGRLEAIMGQLNSQQSVLAQLLPK